MVLPSKLAIITLLVTYLGRGTNEDQQLGFLNKLLQKIQHEEPIETMLVMQHNRDGNCALRNWNHREIPTLRFNQLHVVELRKLFNHVAVGVVCICRDSDTTLLESLAQSFNRMRQRRIILWLQAELTQEMLNVISNQVEEHQLLQMLILEVREEPIETVAVRRLDPFPNAHFLRIDNILDLEGPIFLPPEMNFKERTINLLPNWGAAFKINVTLPSKISVPIVRNQDLGVLMFALKYNLRLRVLEDSYNLTSSVVPDIQLNTQIHTKMANLRTWNPYDISSLVVAVPCGKQWRIEEVFKQLNVQSWLFHIFVVYAIFVLAETFILAVNYRISGKAYRLISLNPLLNLRAFQALLGMSFPIGHNSSLSLRQLFLSISVFGLIFSNFFSCKLSALLTKQSAHPCVRNFDDLRTSGLNVIIGPTIRAFVDSEAGSEFVKNNLTNVKYISQEDRIRMMLSPGYNNAYLLFSENWSVVDKFQKLYGRKFLCTSENLTINQGLPITHILKNNSMLEQSLFSCNVLAIRK
ncbi:uncharacterized protein [Drosophila takahashii]|uniref:uncharacterized protein n=1 Tax=Drosophila takahashii TaxID=29030 RepID=UPI001CF83831|nr:uncharacterized protein LOC123003025 [Drosophila takahashii]